MICEHFIHIGIGDTGEGIIRSLIQERFITTGRLEMKGTLAHQTLAQSRLLCSDAPAFTFVRNPYSWYISRWIHAMRHRHYRGTFREFLLNPDVTLGKWRETFWETYVAYTEDAIPPERVGRFEHYVDDFVRVFSPLVSDIYPEDEIRNWFPDAFKQWRGENWIEDIEAAMRSELYTDEMRMYVEHHDAVALRRWGYAFDA